MKKYIDILTEKMEDISKISNSIFLGQQIVYYGNPMSKTLVNVPKEKMIELPVMEESQMGISLGLALSNKFVVTFYPRWDFLISASNQLINHVDKFQLMTGKKVNLLIRVGKGSDIPLDPGHQHKANYYSQYKEMCPNMNFFDLKNKNDVKIAYDYVIQNGGVNLLAEYPELYDN